ncbi:hypothetical protein ACLKA7_003204 [Drosophila subpalustris]
MDPFGSSWNNPNLCIPSGAQVWYTDGSKLENGDTGAGVYGPRFRRSIAMGKTPSIFQAEIHAIEVCAIECIRRRMQGATIFILSDSQAALKALESFKITSKLVDNCLHSVHWSRKHQNMFYVNAQHSAGVGYKYWERREKVNTTQQDELRIAAADADEVGRVITASAHH